MRTLWKADVRYPILLAAVSLLLWSPRLRGPIDLRYDAGVYYVLGTSIAEGKGYRLLNEPGEIHAVQYPPLLPAIVAVEQKLAGTSDPQIVGHWLRLTYCAMFIVYSIAVYAMARQMLGSGYAFLVALVCILSSDLLYLSDLLQAELPFAMITMLFVVSSRVLAKPQATGAARFVLSSILGIAAFLMRSAGIALLGAWVGEAFIRKQWKQVILRSAVALVPLVAWQAWVAHVKASDEYRSPAYAYQRAPYQYYNVTYGENLSLIDSFKPELGHASKSQLAKRIMINLTAMPWAMGDAVSSARGAGYRTIDLLDRKLDRPASDPIVAWETVDVVMIVFGTVVFVGIVMIAVRRQFFLPLYVLATLGLICLTPWPKQFSRYLAPAAPFLVLSVVVLLSAVRKRWPNRVVMGIVGLVLILMPLMQVTTNAFVFATEFRGPGAGEPRLFYVSDGWHSWNDAIAWLGQHSHPQDVIATSAPHSAHLKSARKAVLPPMEANPDEELRLLDSVPVRYLVVGTFEFLEIDTRYVEPMIQYNPEAWRLVYTVPDGLTRVYERVGE